MGISVIRFVRKTTSRLACASSVSFTFFFLLLWPNVADSATYDELVESQAELSEEAIFVRCYSHFTGSRANYDHPVRAAVRAGSTSAVDGCMQVFDKAMVSPGTRQIASSTDMDGVRTLNTFFSFHKSWFEFKDMSRSPQGGHLKYLYDAATDACFLTHALFSGTGIQPGTNAYQNTYDYRNIVTSNAEVQCRRTELTKFTPYNYFSYTAPEYANYSTWANSTGRGFILGTYERAPYDHTWYSRTGRPITTISHFGGGQSENLKDYMPHTHGGGLLGSKSFILKYGQYNRRTDGSTYVRRRITNHIMEELLCRKAPFRRIEDVSGEVADFNSAHPSIGNLPFRNDATCMSCHSTQDGLAGVYRNIATTGSQGYNDWNDNGVFGRPDGENNYNRLKDGNDRTAVVYGYDVSQPSLNREPHMVVNDNRYTFRPARGTLVYRSFDGSEIYHEISPNGQSSYPAGEGIQALGQLLSQGNDLYVCAASRYFEFFTGIEVNLNDPGDSRNAPLSEADEQYKALVVNLGLNLKSHQSLRALVKEIISSPIYRKVGLRNTN